MCEEPDRFVSIGDGVASADTPRFEPSNCAGGNALPRDIPSASGVQEVAAASVQRDGCVAKKQDSQVATEMVTLRALVLPGCSGDSPNSIGIQNIGADGLSLRMTIPYLQ